MQGAFFAPRWPDIVTGKKALLPELAEALAHIAPDVPAEVLVDYWFRNDSRIDLGVVDAMMTLRAAGHPVYLATNQEHMRAAYLMDAMGLKEHVDGIFYSAAIGHRKPAPGFYGHIQSTLAAAPDDLTLIDDTEANVLAARDHGWRGVHWQPGMSVLAALDRW